ncbi:hypothetical protein ONZ45_g3210 [Pleurotus djamor]|nr:hypothetical protein ONZ45_g3210 [Pleurotus djamor]
MSSSYDLTSSVLLNTAIIEKVERYTIKDADFNGFLTFVDGLSLGEAPYIEGKDWTPKLSFLDEAAVPKPGMPVPLTVMFNDFDETMHKEDHNTDFSAYSAMEPLPTLQGAELLVPSSERKNTTQKTTFTEGLIPPGEDVTWLRFALSHGTLPVSCTMNGFPCPFDWKDLVKSSRRDKEQATYDVIGEESPGDVAKLSWPDFGKKPLNADIFRRLRNRILSRRYGHLSELTNLKEFKAVYIDIVECHYYAYKLGYTSRAGAAPFVALDFLEAD